MEIKNCPGKLLPGYDTYSPAALKEMFSGVRVSPCLDFNYDSDEVELMGARKRISISGAQEKASAVLDGKTLRLAREGERGTYILKPVPGDKGLQRRFYMPANEHLTMQIAAQVFGIRTAANALAFFKDGSPVYVTRRFDYAPDGTKIPQEDFAALSGRSLELGGPDFKYKGSYLEIGHLIRKYVGAWQVQCASFLKLVIFNYLFCNGDAHLKNFSLQQTPDGDYLLSPAYDLMNTSLHIHDEDFCLSEGLMPKVYHSEIYDIHHHPNFEDFIRFGLLLEIPEAVVLKVVNSFLGKKDKVDELVDRSFLDDTCRRMYKRSVGERYQRFIRKSKEE